MANLFIKDLFTGVSATPITSHSPNVGGTYSTSLCGTSGSWAISNSNRARMSGSGTQTVDILTDALGANVTVDWDWVIIAGVDNVGPTIRHVHDTFDGYYWCRLLADKTIQFLGVNNSSVFLNHITPALPSVADGTTIPMRAVLVNDVNGTDVHITLYANGSVVAFDTFTDAATQLTGLGKIGLSGFLVTAGGDAAGTHIDNLYAASPGFTAPGIPSISISTSGNSDTITIPVAATPGDRTIVGYKLYSGTTSNGESGTAVDTITPSSFPATFAIQNSGGVKKYYIAKAYDNGSVVQLSSASNEVTNQITVTLNANALHPTQSTTGSFSDSAIFSPIQGYLSLNGLIDINSIPLIGFSYQIGQFIGTISGNTPLGNYYLILTDGSFQTVPISIQITSFGFIKSRPTKIVNSSPFNNTAYNPRTRNQMSENLDSYSYPYAKVITGSNPNSYNRYGAVVDKTDSIDIIPIDSAVSGYGESFNNGSRTVTRRLK